MSAGGSIDHLSSSNGLLKISHVILGGISLVLVATSYVPFWALDVFLISVGICFGISTLLLILFLALPRSVRTNYYFTVSSSIFHSLAGLVLIIAGIDLIGWSDYDKHCSFNCPRIYYIGVAKILTFINGTLYGIHGFLEARGERQAFGESLPLLENERCGNSPPVFNVVVHPPSSDYDYPNPHHSRNIINS